MTDTKTATPPPDATRSPDEALAARINELQGQIKAIQGEIRTLLGKVANRDPAALRSLSKENGDLKLRLSFLEKALFGLVSEGLKPKQAEDGKLQYEVLRQAAVEYCKQANIDPEIWKNIAS